MEYKTFQNLPDPDLWQNDSYFNITATNGTSVVFMPLIPPAMDKAISAFMVIILFITMVSLGCTMEVEKIKVHIVKPKGVAIAVVAQYGVMPLAAFSLAKVFQLAPMEAVTVLICGCSPGGNLSNLLTLALQGDMNLSIVMTSCSTVLALGMMPLLLYLYCQGFSNLQDAIPYKDIILALVMVLIPCGIGIFINHYRPQYSKIISKVGLSIMMIAAVVIGVMASITVGGAILTMLSGPFMAIGALMPLIGYIFGYSLSFIFRLSGREGRTTAMETGCQNIQLCSTILKVAFPQEVIGPLFLFPMVYIAFQLIEAVALILLFRGHQWLKHKQKEVTYQPATNTTLEVMEPSDVTV